MRLFIKLNIQIYSYYKTKYYQYQYFIIIDIIEITSKMEKFILQKNQILQQKIFQMEKPINLQETSFIDLAKNDKQYMHYQLSQSHNPFNNLPPEEDNIDYRTYNVVNYKPKKNIFQSKNQEKKLDRLIQIFLENFKLGIDIQNMEQFKKNVNELSQLIIKYKQKGEPKSIFICLITESWHLNYNVTIQQLKKAEETNYPLLLMILGMNSFKKTKGKDKNWQNYFKKAINYKQGAVFVQYGILLYLKSQFNHAYELYKNAYQLGFQPVACKLLGSLFLNDYFQKSLRIAKKYFDQAVKLNAFLDKKSQQSILFIKKEFQYEILKAESIKCPQDIQAKIVSNFLMNKMQQYHTNFQQMYTLGTTNNFCNPESFGLIEKKKIFYVVFAPMMRFPSRGFLAQDENGNIQAIYLYNWKYIPTKKLKLLHKLGTKVILSKYIRKLGSNDHLPMYRVENPYSVQILEGTQKHFIEDKKLRKFAAILFQQCLFDQSMNIYLYLIMKKANEQQIIYSNIGLIHQKRDQIQQAIKCYKKSLLIKFFYKSQIRLANIYIMKKMFKQAYEIVQKIEVKQQKQKLIKQLQKYKTKFQNNQNLGNNIVYKKKNLVNQIPKLNFIGKFSQNQSNNANLRQGKDYYIFYKKIFCQKLKINQKLNDEAYLKQLQQIYDSVGESKLQKNKVQRYYLYVELTYQLQLKKSLPFSQSYLNQIIQDYIKITIMDLPIGIQLLFGSILRTNYLQHRIENMCLEFERFQKYQQAEVYYRYTGNNCSPFNVKVAEMLYLQKKYHQCISFCQSLIIYFWNKPINHYFPYFADIIKLLIKSHLQNKQYQVAVKKGEKYCKILEQKNIKKQHLSLKYQDSFVFSQIMSVFSQNFQKKNVKTKPTRQKFQHKPIRQKFQQIVSSQNKFNLIYKQILLGYLSLKDDKNSQNYLNKIIITNLDNENYYQMVLIRTQILKNRKSSNEKILQYIQIGLKHLSDAKIQNKQIYQKYLLKEKLTILLQLRQIQQVIKLVNTIVQTNPINETYAKSKLFNFMIKNLNYSIKTIKLLSEYQILKLVSDQLFIKLSIYLKDELNNNKNKIDQSLLDYFKLSEQFKQLDQKQQQINLNRNNQQAYYLYRKVFDQYNYQEHNQQQNKKNKQQQDDSIIALDIRQIQEEQKFSQIQGFINSFVDNNARYIVIFNQKLKIDQITKRKFIVASDRICKRKNGVNGIKILQNHQIRLKISDSSRLMGKILQKDSHTFICFFNTFESHDSYKRK